MRSAKKTKAPRRARHGAFKKTHYKIDFEPSRLTIKGVIAGNMKSAIVRPALMGYLSAPRAQWLIQRGGLTHE
jgi:hypothetical protein